MVESKSKRFVVDKMLGKLAKWLRILGYDTFYTNKIKPETLLSIAISENRIILTRNHKLLKQKNRIPVILIHSDTVKEQLRELNSKIPLSANHLFTRCPICNQKTHPIEKEKVKGVVPPYVYQTEDKFTHCIQCGRTYWKGTHITHAKEWLKSIEIYKEEREIDFSS
jgi:hypothetical protein